MIECLVATDSGWKSLFRPSNPSRLALDGDELSDSVSMYHLFAAGLRPGFQPASGAAWSVGVSLKPKLRNWRLLRVERATRKNSQLAPAQRVAMKMGRRLRCSSVTYRCRYAPSTASPARTALPTAHFDRNNIPAISGTGHEQVKESPTQLRMSDGAPASSRREAVPAALH